MSKYWRYKKAKETKRFIKGTDFDADIPLSIPPEWVEERVVLEPEPPVFSTVIVRLPPGTPFSAVFDVRTFTRKPNGWRDNSYTIPPEPISWEELNLMYDDVEIIE